MKKDQLDPLFDSLQGQFDTEEPQPGHEGRFRERLKAKADSEKFQPSRWPRYAIAASLAFLLGIGLYFGAEVPSKEVRLAEISPEATHTQRYFAGVIEEQVQLLQAEDNPLTRKLVNDALLQLEALESDYSKLENDLLNGGDSKLILSAMITNFQTRIDLLHEVMNTIAAIKALKSKNNEDHTV